MSFCVISIYAGRVPFRVDRSSEKTRTWLEGYGAFSKLGPIFGYLVFSKISVMSPPHSTASKKTRCCMTDCCSFSSSWLHLLLSSCILAHWLFRSCSSGSSDIEADRDRSRSLKHFLPVYIMVIPSTQIAAAIPPSGPDGSLTVHISKTHPVPKPGDGEVLVKLEYSGVCHSDVHSIRGDTPMLTDVAGHEGVGKIVSGKWIYREEKISSQCIFTELSSAAGNSNWSELSLVGSNLDEKEWLGHRVGIRWIYFHISSPPPPNDTTRLWYWLWINFRWLYSSCLKCEICEINHTSCPYQKNAGAVGSWAYASFISIFYWPPSLFFPIHADISFSKNVPGTFQRKLSHTLLKLIFCLVDVHLLNQTWLSSEYLVSPAIHATKLPPELAPDTAAPLLCGTIFYWTFR